MPIVNSSSGGFYTDRIGTTDDGFPVYLYFDPAAAAFRPTVVPPAGNPYYASAETRILHETAQVSPGMPDFPLKVALSLRYPTISAIGSTIRTTGLPVAAISSSRLIARCASI